MNVLQIKSKMSHGYVNKQTITVMPVFDIQCQFSLMATVPVIKSNILQIMPAPWDTSTNQLVLTTS